MTALVLASGSAVRATLLKNAGIDFDVRPASVDERALEASLVAGRIAAGGIAIALAEAKALAVSKERPGALVIGADQVLAADGRRWNKPADRDAAGKQIAALAGKTHVLHSAVAVARGDAVLWRHEQTARLTMRPLSPDDIVAYLDRAGAAVLSSVGAYQLEGPGIQLFDRIEGDYFAILGLPLLPLLAFLRGEGAIR